MNKRILIAGGGTAGWMAASLFQHAWPDSTISVIESAQIGPIGVGEGSTPYLKQFFKSLNIDEHEWMPKCNATYKAGIYFKGWSERPGYEDYFHPFFSPLDIKPGEPFFHNAALQRRGVKANAHPDHYFVNKQIVELGKAPISSKKLGIELDYGYHFDAVLLGRFLKDRAIHLGVTHIEDMITQVALRKDGDVAHLETKANGNLSADLFIDCTGFQSLILQKALGVKFHSYSDSLFNDAAVAIPTPNDTNTPIQAQTISTALKCGWCWHIPLTNRVGNGYVYDSSEITQEQAEQELREHLQLADRPDIPAKHLKMKVGRVDKHWHRNCLAVGLAQGFIEPLEATALMVVQFTIEQFIAEYEKSIGPGSGQFNQRVNQMFEGIRDYITTHYKINSRTDTPYWEKCREQSQVSPNLEQLLNSWDNGTDFEKVLSSQKSDLVYLRPSWYVILAGMGRFPIPLKDDDNLESIPHEQCTRYCADLVQDCFVDHAEYLNQLRSVSHRNQL